MASPETLVELLFATSAAIALVLALRRPLRKAFGARVAYGAWALVPALLVAVWLPAARVAPTAITMAFPRALPAMVQPAASGPATGMLLTAVWVMGIVACATAMALRQWRFRRSLGSLAERADGAHEAERDSDGLPATVGLWSPQVVVPPAFDTRFDPTQRALMLAHERAHVQRGDVQANALAAALRCLFWFNPLLHFAAPRFRQDQELACDATVLEAFPHARRRYGEALLQVQLDVQATPLGCHFGFGHPLRERIAMLREQLPSASRRVLGTALVCLVSATFAFVAWATQPGQGTAAGVSQQEVSGSSLPPPKYPAYAAEHNLSGRVVLMVDVAPDGSVANAVVERSEPKGVFDDAAMKAVMGWKFNPARKDGKAVSSQVRVPVDFRPDPKEGREAGPMQVAAGQSADPADYEWIRQDLANGAEIRQTQCDVVKLDSESGVSYCGIRKK